MIMELKKFVTENNLENTPTPLTFFHLKHENFKKEEILYVQRIAKSKFYQTLEFECVPFYKPISML